MTGPRALVSALVAPAGRRDPYPIYEQLRAHGGLIDVKPGLMFAVGYAECDAALREPRLRVQDADSYDRIYPAWRDHSSLRAYTDSMLYRNAPDHTRMRRLAGGNFTVRRVQAMQAPIERVTDRLLDDLAVRAADGPVDFIAEFAARLPIAVISELLGVPERDQTWFREVAARVSTALEGITGAGRLAVADRAMDELADYFTTLIGRRRRDPGADVVSAMVQAHDAAGAALSHDEMVGNMMLMLTAGFETTSFLLGYALLIALRRPELAGRLRDRPDFAAGYVQEVLRYESPVQATSRWAAEDVQVGGHAVPAGTKLVAVLAAGNRDPGHFREPGLFDPDRPPFVPLSFGAGSHYCLGAPLSRLEAQIALPRLLRRFPDVTAAGEPVRRDAWIGRGLDRFPIALKSA